MHRNYYKTTQTSKKMVEKVGKNAGLIWNALNNAGKALEAKEIKKATELIFDNITNYFYDFH